MGHGLWALSSGPGRGRLADELPLGVRIWVGMVSKCCVRLCRGRHRRSSSASAGRAAVVCAWVRPSAAAEGPFWGPGRRGAGCCLPANPCGGLLTVPAQGGRTLWSRWCTLVGPVARARASLWPVRMPLLGRVQALWKCPLLDPRASVRARRKGFPLGVCMWSFVLETLTLGSAEVYL